MIENIRKYTGLMIVVFVILFISFFFLDTGSMQNLGGGGGYIKVDGRVYNEKEFRRLGVSSYELAQRLGGWSNPELQFFLFSMTGGIFDGDQAAENFFASRMVLRKAGKEFGIHPGNKEINQYIRAIPVFTGQDGEFNEETYRNFVQRGLGRMGMTESDLRELAEDILISRKLNAIIGSGLSANSDFIAKNFAFENQRISGEIARLSLSDYEDIEPTEEQIKEYWENIQDAFMTEPLRQFTYILVSPAAIEDEEEEEAKETLAEAAMSDEQKAEAAKKKEEARAKRAAELAEKRRTKQLELDQLVDDFLYELEQRKGSGFEELAKENDWEIQTTELFPLSNVPEDLAITLRASSRGGRAVDELFRIEETSDPFSKISEAIAVGENQWIIARLDGEEKSRPKTYAEARNDARAQYILEKANEALKTAADEKAEKIKEAIIAGKSFADAAKENGIEETHVFTEITSFHRNEGENEPRNLFHAVSTVEPGTLADVIVESDFAFLIHVSKRDVLKEDNLETRVNTELVSASGRNETAAYLAWLRNRTAAARVEPLYRRQ